MNGKCQQTPQGLLPVFNIGQLVKLVGFPCADKTGIDPERSLNL